MGFIDHLEELRWHLIRSVIAVVVFAVLAFLGKSFVYNVVILGPSRADFFTFRMLCQLGELTGFSEVCISEDLPFELISRRVQGQFIMHITTSCVVGIVCAFPYVFWEIWRFVQPGLYPNERKLSRGATFFVSLLFMSGVLFGYYVISPLSLNFLANYTLDPSIKNYFDISSYISILAMLVLACGLMFQLPMVVYFLSRVGVVTPKVMRTYRKHALVVILFVAAVITPPDVFSQLMIGLPIFLLYEVSIFISASVVRKLAKEEAALRERYAMPEPAPASTTPPPNVRPPQGPSQPRQG